VQLGLTKRELAEVEAQLQMTLREKRRGELTRKELDRVTDGTPMYQSVGKTCCGGPGRPGDTLDVQRGDTRGQDGGRGRGRTRERERERERESSR